MKAKEFIIESRGLFGRSQGDIFTDDNGNEIRFQSIDIFPSDKPNDAFADEKTTQKAFDKVLKGNKPSPVNDRGSRARAFAIATLVRADGNKEFWVKWANTVPGNILGWWKNSEVPKEGPRWVLKSKTAQKARSGLTPQDLIKTDKQAFDTVPSIVDRIAPGLPDPIREGVGMVAAGKLPAVFAGQKANMEAIRDHLGEIIQPIGLMSGVIKGDAEKAANDVLGAPYSQCKVVWPQSKNTGLIDSYFIGPSGKTLGVSSKGDKGANASVQNIEKAIAESSDVLRKKHAKAIDIINTISQASAKEGPVALGLKLGLINESEMTEMLGYINTPSKKPRGLSPKLKYFMSKIAADPKKMGYSAGYHMLAGLAKDVCDRVNAMPEFTKACIDFLNQSSIIQVYTEAKVVKDNVEITGFRSVYPPNFQGTVVLTSSKVYYSSGIKGKFTFDYRK